MLNFLILIIFMHENCPYSYEIHTKILGVKGCGAC